MPAALAADPFHREPPVRRRAPTGAILAGLALVALLLPPAPAAAQRAGQQGAQQNNSSNSFRYAPPQRTPPPRDPRYVELPPDRVLPIIQAGLAEQKLRIEQVDNAQRVIVARFSGDGRDYMDCGTVEMLVDGRRQRPPKVYSANRPDTRTYREIRGRRIGLYRDMSLDARLVVKLDPSGRGTSIRSDAVYVATRSVYQVVRGGDIGALGDREIVSFRSTETGRFAKGTRCVATGKLEEIAALPFR